MPTNSQKTRHRESIQVGNLLGLLWRNANGTLKDHDGKRYELSNGRIKSAMILLNKALPDLQSMQYENVTPDYGRPEQVKEQYQELLKQAIHSMSPEELQKLMEAH